MVLSRFAQAYALVRIREALSQPIPDHPEVTVVSLIKDHREQIAKLESCAIPLWPSLSEPFRKELLKRIYPYARTALALDLDDVTWVIAEHLKENGVALQPEWIKSNLLAFRRDLEAML